MFIYCFIHTVHMYGTCVHIFFMNKTPQYSISSLYMSSREELFSVSQKQSRYLIQIVSYPSAQCSIYLQIMHNMYVCM